MAHTESDYAALAYQHQQCVAALKALRSEHNESKEAWAEKEKDLTDTISACRRFFERILAKNPEEISKSFGKECNWGALDTRTLLNKANAAYDLYNRQRTELLKRIQGLAEERSRTIENLIMQLELLKSSEGGSDSFEEKMDKHRKAVSSETMARVNYSLQEAAGTGDVFLEIEEEEDDVSPTDLQQMAEMGVVGLVLGAERDQGIHITKSQKVLQKLENEVRASSGSLLYSVDEIRERMAEKHWCSLVYIGNTGTDSVKEITEDIVAQCAEGNITYAGHEEGCLNFSITAIRIALRELCSMQLLSMTTVMLPVGKKQLCKLTEKGVLFYREATGKDPIESQFTRIIRDHDNPEHGYGILYLAKLLEEKGVYSSISFERKGNSIKLNKDGETYIPDIIAITKKKSRRGNPYKHYFEYERDTHQIHDFFIKLNKMALVTSKLFLVAPNTEAVAGLKAKVDKWIDSRGKTVGTMEHTVYITTYKKLASVPGVEDADGWIHIIRLSDCGKGSATEQNETKPPKATPPESTPPDKKPSTGKLNIPSDGAVIVAALDEDDIY